MIEVIGRNGFKYDATPLTSNFYIVGKFIVTVVDGRCDETVCRATKANIAKYKGTGNAVRNS